MANGNVIRRFGLIAAGVAGLAFSVCNSAIAQVTVTAPTNSRVTIEPATTNVIVPQHRAWAIRDGAQAVIIDSVGAAVDLYGQVATTALEIVVSNPGSAPQEAQLLLPVPQKAAVRHFGYDGSGTETEAKLLPREDARRIYESIVSQMRDPALLEFVGYDLIKTSVFPVPAGGKQTVRLTYENLCDADGERIDYALPRSDSFENSSVKWTIKATVRSDTPISTVYSPSHQLSTSVGGPGLVNVSVPDSAMQPGAFRMSVLREKVDGINATILAYPDPDIGGGNGGYFMLLGGVPSQNSNERQETQKREVIIVLDRSGSMRGEKIEQARAAALQIVEGLKMGEAFNILDYSDTIAKFSEQPVVKDEKTLGDARVYLAGLQAEGGTNIHDALGEAMKQTPTAGMLPMTLFLTDGLPTVGITGEIEIRDAISKANTNKRRIFTFGVGYDVNAPLLDKLAENSRAASINVLPNENIEVAVSRVFKRLSGPVLGWPTLTAVNPDGSAATRTVRDLLPGTLPDLFEGDQLVVFGQYADTGEIALKLEGDGIGGRKAHQFSFRTETAGSRNAFVPRLWASRKIAVLLDQIRQMPADPNMPADDPRKKELVDEIVRLSTRFGILTEYTAFLATEPAVAAAGGVPGAVNIDMFAASAVAAENASRLVQDRNGISGVNQSMNTKMQAMQTCDNKSNRYWDASMNSVTINTVLQVRDQTMFCRGTKWVDSRIMTMQGPEVETPEQTIEFASKEYFDLAQNLANQGLSGLLAVPQDCYLLVEGKRTLVKAPVKAG